jgi:hypothetical protein
MHKKYTFSILLFIGFSLNACEISPLLELKPGYFFFADSLMRKIYHKGGFEIQGSGSYPLWKWLNLYASVGYLRTQGRSINGDEKTVLWQVPVDIGLKAILEVVNKVSCYVGFGPRYFYVHQHNDSQYVDNNLHRYGIGLFSNIGFNFYPVQHGIVGLFSEYGYEKASFCPHTLNVHSSKGHISGVTFGVTLGYAF